MRLSGAAALLVLGLTGTIGPAGAQGAQDAPARAVRVPAASVAVAARRELVGTVPIEGSLVARDSVSIFAQVQSARIEAVLVDIGDRVEAGEVLVRLDARPLQVQLAQDEAAIAAGEAAVQQATSQIEGQSAALEQADRVFSRAERLLRSGAGAQSTLDDARSALASAQASLKAARDAKANAQALVEQSKAKRDDTALQLERTQVRAPVAGLVVTRAADLGQIAATGGDPLFTLVQNGVVEFEGKAIETALGQLKPGQRTTVYPSGAPPRAGAVRLVSPRVDVATRQGIVKIALDDDQDLPIGLFGRAVVETMRRQGVTVPLSAVMTSAQGSLVQRVGADGTLETRQVTTGILDGAALEIVEGLSAGDTVVAKAAPFFRDGMRIRPVPLDETPVPEPVAPVSAMAPPGDVEAQARTGDARETVR
ncbi:hypothetical protein ASG48_13955 [Aurantimonas sp. Leaf443]|nr:hypothetical protein ASG48_13955 [Aurantimonas sp. Leaf443]